jgi:hypothetical protein
MYNYFLKKFVVVTGQKGNQEFDESIAKEIERMVNNFLKKFVEVSSQKGNRKFEKCIAENIECMVDDFRVTFEKVTGQEGKRKLDEFIAKEIKRMVDDFLENLVMVTGQKGNQELDEFIGDKIKSMNIIKLKDDDYKQIVHRLKTPLQDWWRSNIGVHITKHKIINWLNTANTEHFTPFVAGLINVCPKELVREITFSNSEISGLKDQIADKRAVHLRSDELKRCGVLLLHCTASSKRIFVDFESLESDKDLLLHAWLGGHWDWLVAFCDSTVQPADVAKTCKDIHRRIKPVPHNKHLIILTARSVQQIADFVPIEH